MITKRYLLLLINSRPDLAALQPLALFASALNERTDWHGLIINDLMPPDGR